MEGGCTGVSDAATNLFVGPDEVPMAWMREHKVPHEKVNVNGGAISLGHPLGCSGAKLMTTLLNELERTGGRWGLQTMCEGGGQANVTILERL